MTLEEAMIEAVHEALGTEHSDHDADRHVSRTIVRRQVMHNEAFNIEQITLTRISLVQ